MSEHSSIKTPLGKAKGTGSAKDGTHHWWMQRLTAICLLPLIVFFVTCPSCFASPDYSAVVSWIATQKVSIALILFMIAACYHAALGLQVVIEDYVHDTGTKMFMLIAMKILFFVAAVVSIHSILYIDFGLYG